MTDILAVVRDEAAREGIPIEAVAFALLGVGDDQKRALILWLDHASLENRLDGRGSGLEHLGLSGIERQVDRAVGELRRALMLALPSRKRGT